MEERRRSPRYQLRQADLAVLPSAVEVQVLDISIGGALLQSSRPVKVGARGSLRLNVSGVPFTADVEIRRSSPDSPDSSHRIGAMFVSINPESRHTIERFINQ